MAKRQLLTERHGTSLAVFFLDPLTALDLDDPCDRDTVCHEYTCDGETMRYAIESSDDMKMRMKIDAILVTSLSAVPGHVTAGVVTGDVAGRYERVVKFFDDITRVTVVEQVDNDLRALVKKAQHSHPGSKILSS